MSIAAPQTPFIEAEEYLAGEAIAQSKKEYLNGVVYAVAGATQRHNDIAGNIYGVLHAKLRGRPCRPYGSDMLLRVEQKGDLRFYCPDISIVCRPAGPNSRTQSEPSVIFEVLSESTARTDTGEKRMAYLTIAALEAYVLVSSTERTVTVWRRKADTWTPEAISEPEAILTFASADCTLSLGEIYESTGL